MSDFEQSWPKEFHSSIKKNIKTMSAIAKKGARADVPAECLNTELIYARVIGIMASSRQTIPSKEPFAHELASILPAHFNKNVDLRVTTKSILKNSLKVERSSRNTICPEVVIVDACAILWTVSWPSAPDKVSDFVNAAVGKLLQYLRDA